MGSLLVRKLYFRERESWHIVFFCKQNNMFKNVQIRVLWMWVRNNIFERQSIPATNKPNWRKSRIARFSYLFTDCETVLYYWWIYSKCCVFLVFRCHRKMRFCCYYVSNKTATKSKGLGGKSYNAHWVSYPDWISE